MAARPAWRRAVQGAKSVSQGPELRCPPPCGAGVQQLQEWAGASGRVSREGVPEWSALTVHPCHPKLRCRPRLELVLPAPAAAARRPCEAADSASLDPEKRSPLLGPPAAQRGGRPRDPERALFGELGVPGRTSETRPEGETHPLDAARIERSTSAASWPQSSSKRTSLEGGQGPGTSAVPTERPRKLRCPQEPPARTGPPLATEEAAPLRAARVLRHRQ